MFFDNLNKYFFVYTKASRLDGEKVPFDIINGNLRC